MYNAPCIVTDYPKDIKAFYMKLNPDGKTVAAMDILVPKIGESRTTPHRSGSFLVIYIFQFRSSEPCRASVICLHDVCTQEKTQHTPSSKYIL